MEDFGTGFNSPKHILKFPMDIIKIDEYFVDKVDENQTRVLIEGIINTKNLSIQFCLWFFSDSLLTHSR
jgi:EAL domain-containing protein (putative c-di-GMP-specific phosphodiesterase class I)